MRQIWKKAIGIIISAALCLQLGSLCTGAAVIDVAAGKSGGGSNLEEGYGAEKLTDGNESLTSMAWIYGNTGHVYIDLKKPYNIEAIEILAYNGVDAQRSGNFDIYLTNEVPTETTANKVKVGTHEAPNDLYSEPIPYVRYEIDPTVKETAYRYVSLEKFSDAAGLIVQEVKVYANSEEEQPPESGVNIAAGKPNGFGPASAYFDVPPTLSGGNRLTDGDTSVEKAVIDYDSEDGSEYVYIDLEDAQKISNLEIVAYGINGCGNFNIYLTNTNPAGGLPADKALVGSVPVGYIATAEEGTSIYDVPAEYVGQAYRYIVLARISQAGRLVVNEVKAFTKADDLQFGLSEGVFTISGSSLSIKGKATNGSTDSAVALLSAYDSEGKFTGAQAVDITLPTLCVSEEWSLNLDVAAVLEDAPERVNLAFLDNLTDRYLLFMVEDVASEATVTNLVRADGVFTYNAEQDRQSILLSGNAPGSTVMVMVLKAGTSFDSLTAADVQAKVLYCSSVQTEADGSYHIAAKMPDGTVTDSYPLGFALAGTTTSEKMTSFAYATFDPNAIMAAFKTADATTFAAAMETYGDLFESLKADITAAGADFGKSFVLARDCMKNYRFNSEVAEIASVDDIETVLRAALLIHATIYTTDFDVMVDRYKDSMPLVFGKYYDGVEFETVLNKLKGSNALATAGDVYNTYQKTMGLCAILDGSNSDKMYALENYRSYLGISDTDIGDTSIADIAKRLGNKESDIDRYIGGMGSVVRNAVAAIKEAENSDTKHVTSSGSGGSKKSSAVALPYVETDGEVTEAEPITSPEGYQDLSGYDWAKTAIENLTQQKILKGISENQFAPERLLSRGEAAKIMVLAFGLTTGDEEIVYNDCDIAAWYYPYVEAASANGLMVGVDRHTFGVNNSITRQDMAVVLSRALAKQGIWVKGDQELSFTDAASIAPYASDSVRLLSELEIITGADDGAFYPQEHITRAQAAVMIDRALTLLAEQKG